MTHFWKHKSTPTEPRRSRRGFLALGMLAMAASLCPERVLARPRQPVTLTRSLPVQRVPAPPQRLVTPEKSLAFYNPNTGEKLNLVYWFKGKYLPDSLRAINHVLRDHHSDEMRSIDPQLLDLLHAIGKKVDTRQPFHVISAYRSPTTNAWLRQFNSSVAEQSLHTEGRAVDLRLPGCDIAMVRRVALALHSGGVGYYPYANFVHVDTGPVRRW